VLLALTPTPGANPLSLSAEVNALLPDIVSQLPPGMELNLVYELSAHMTVTQEPRAFLKGACAELQQVLGVQWLVLRFAEAVATERNPVHLEITGGDPAALYAELEARVTDPRRQVGHRWAPGDLLIVDNHRYLHGRAPLGANTGRAFRRVQVM